MCGVIESGYLESCLAWARQRVRSVYSISGMVMVFIVGIVWY